MAREGALDGWFLVPHGAAKILLFILTILSIVELCQVKTISIRNFMVIAAIMLAVAGIISIEFAPSFLAGGLRERLMRTYLGFYLFVSVVAFSAFLRMENVWSTMDHGAFATRYDTTLNPALDFRMYAQFQGLCIFIIACYAVDMAYTLALIAVWSNLENGGWSPVDLGEPEPKYTDRRQPSASFRA